MENTFNDIDAMQKHMRTLNINGMHGRMMRIPSTKKNSANRELLMLYGHHASLERIFGIADDMSQYGNVTVPDLPGFGGMDSFYTIGMEPTLDNFADYLATFIKLRYRGKKLTIMGMSLGFVVATRMLQRYPELVKKIDLNISLVGFARHDDFTFSRNRMRFYRSMSWFFKHRIPAAFYYNIVLHPSVIKAAYHYTRNARNKFEHMSSSDRKIALEFEVKLWRESDLRTHMATAEAFLRLDNCNKQVNLPVHHVSIDGDQYFDNSVIEQHMRVIFTDFTNYTAVMPFHAPTIIADKEESKPFVPPKLRKLLKKKP